MSTMQRKTRFSLLCRMKVSYVKIRLNEHNTKEKSFFDIYS